LQRHREFRWRCIFARRHRRAAVPKQFQDDAAQMTNQKKPNNLKTALIMASIALLFFVGVIARRMWF
jgi:hypothetical protein